MCRCVESQRIGGNPKDKAEHAGRSEAVRERDASGLVSSGLLHAIAQFSPPDVSCRPARAVRARMSTNSLCPQSETHNRLRSERKINFFSNLGDGNFEN